MRQAANKLVVLLIRGVVTIGTLKGVEARERTGIIAILGSKEVIAGHCKQSWLDWTPLDIRICFEYKNISRKRYKKTVLQNKKKSTSNEQLKPTYQKIKEIENILNDLKKKAD